MVSGVYAILNLLNGTVYVGSALDVRYRWHKHKRTLRLNIHANLYLQNAWNKYGEEAFEFILLECVSKNKLIQREQFYINKYQSFNKNSGYNIRQIAQSNFGLKATNETKNRMRKAGLRRWKNYRTLHPESIVIKICLCGNKITGEPAVVKKTQYCSMRCYTKNTIPWNKGKINVYSKKTLRLMSKNKKGISVGIGHKVSKETREKIRQTLLARNIRIK